MSGCVLVHKSQGGLTCFLRDLTKGGGLLTIVIVFRLSVSSECSISIGEGGSGLVLLGLGGLAYRRFVIIVIHG